MKKNKRGYFTLQIITKDTVLSKKFNALVNKESLSSSKVGERLLKQALKIK